MKNLALVSLLFLPVVLTPAAAFVALTRVSDPAPVDGVYLVVAWDRKQAQINLEQSGAKILGPQSAPFGFFVQAGQQQRQQARDKGHLLVSASALAAICGAAPSGSQS